MRRPRLGSAWTWRGRGARGRKRDRRAPTLAIRRFRARAPGAAGPSVVTRRELHPEPRIVVRAGRSDRKGRSLLSIESAGVRIGSAEVARDRHPLELIGASLPPRSHRHPAPHPVAWTEDAARRAARARWRDHHPAVRTLRRLDVDPDRRSDLAAVLEAVGDALADEGVRRLDLRTGASELLAGTLTGPRWVQGRIGIELHASLAIAYPWTDAPDPTGRLARVIAPLPAPVRRLVRRVAAVRPGQVPELARSTATEARAAIRHRYRPGLHSHAVAGAPAGSHPFAASRYRAIRATFSFVPDALRATPLLDIGCGDGRVLREALDAGFTRALGRELDPALAARAADAVGDPGAVEVGDALATPIPDDVGVVFLNNPFDDAGVAQLAALLAESLDRQPRPLLVLYLNPRPIGALLNAGLVLVHVDPRFSIFASRAER